MKLLVVAHDHVGRTMSGPGIRAYHLACELASRFDVTLMAPNPVDLELDGVETILTPPPRELAAAIARFDVVVARYLPAATVRRLVHTTTRVVYDLYVPFVPEGLAMLAGQQEATGLDVLHWRSAVHLQRLALATGDAFVCASERQRDLYLGMLAELGRIDVDRYRSDPALRDMIDVVPFGLPDVPPEPGAPALKGVVPGIGQHDRVLVWGGGIWNWLDPLTPIRAVARLAQRRDDVKLVFLGRKHPQMPEMAMAATAVDLARRLRVLDRCVFFHDEWVPYAERGRYLLEADVGISAHFETVETRFAFRTRLLDYFWAGLPTVTTRGDVLGDLVEARRLGRAVDAGDADGWIEALGTLLDGVDEAARAKRAAQEVRAELAWPIVAEPLRRLAEQSGPKVRTSSWLLELEGLVLRSRLAVALDGPLGALSRQTAKMRRFVR